jgi:hypothetical protein
MTPLEREEVLRLKQQSPEVYSELKTKKRWETSSRNPDRALKTQHLNIKFWNLLDNLPPKQLNNLVPESILKMDQ